MWTRASIEVMRTPDTLTITCPPNYIVAVVAGCVTLSIVALGLIIFGMTASRQLRVVTILLQVPFLLMTLLLATLHARVILNRMSATVRIETLGFGFSLRNKTFDLKSVQRMTYESYRGSRRLAFEMTDGSRLPVGFFGSLDGYQRATDATNDFLKHAADPEMSMPTRVQ
jgi:hypothetical protein